ncbi:hypothetical protein FBU31_004215 [Coemansia sp. 'formosensis']|nr:hypothetical protein FBU31_004215 [Coemansia sp. 'formosensis']
MSAKNLSFEQTRDVAKTGTIDELKATILDVRTAGEFKDGHVPNAVNVPVGELGQALTLTPVEFNKEYKFNLPKQDSKTEALLVYCKSGMRTKMAVQALAKLGYEDNLYTYSGGWDDYSKQV